MSPTVSSYLYHYFRLYKRSRFGKLICLCLLLLLFVAILFYNITILKFERTEFVATGNEPAEIIPDFVATGNEPAEIIPGSVVTGNEPAEIITDFDPNLPELRKRILEISNSNQFASQFFNNDALYSNDMNKRLFTDLEAGSLNVYTWINLCLDDIDRLKSFISFPYNPFKKYLIHNLTLIDPQYFPAKRIFGYITPPVDGSYSFQVIHYGSIEFWMSPDSLPVNAVLCETSPPVDETRINKKLHEGNVKMSHFTLHLFADKKQYIEMIHTSNTGGPLEVTWKEKYSPEYIQIQPEFMFPFVHDFGDVVVPETYYPPTLPLHAPSFGIIQILHPPDERNKIYIYSPIDINSSVCPSCHYKPSYVDVNPIRNANNIQPIKTYPATPLYKLHSSYVSSTVITQELMERVLNIFKQQLVASNSSTRVSRVLNMERLADNINGDLFLVELLVTHTQDQDPLEERLISEYVVLGHKQHPSSVLCRPVGMEIRRDTFVHFLVTQRKFPHMIREFIQNMERVYEESRDENFGVIIVNYVTPLVNVKTLLRQSKLKHWSVIDFGGPWEKTSAINVGIDSVKNPNDIIFIMDLSVHYPAHLIDTIRKHTFQGYSGFSPIIWYYWCDFTEERQHRGANTGFYSEAGYGLFSMYKSDWIVVGGMDSSKFKSIWGFEDNDLANRVLKSRYVLFRQITRDSFHQHHTYAELWDGKKYE